MKKNYFGKLLAIAMVFAGFSLTSCDENDNAIIDGKVWVKPEVQLVDGGAIIQGSSTKDINAMLGRVRQEIIQAANNGEKFTIDIQTSVLNSTADDNTLNIAAVTGGDLVLNLPANIVTDVPLIIQKQGVADDAVAGPSDNQVEINIPSGGSNIDLEINMPTTTVTLNGGNIDELIAKTAWGTLNIESGVTVNWLKLKDGNAVVKDGGKVLGALMDNNFDVQKEGIRVNNVWKNEVPTAIPTDEDYFYVNKAKILKREDGDRVYFNVWQYSEDPKNEVEIVISDGARADTYVWASTINYRPTITILGEGDAKLIGSGYKDGEGKIHPNNSYIPLSGIKTMTGVTADLTHCLVWNDETEEYEEVEIEKDSYTQIELPQNAKDCKFKAMDIYGNNTKISNCSLLANYSVYSINPDCDNTTFKGSSVSFTGNVSGNSATVKNCKFEGTDDDLSTRINLPYQTPNRSSFNFTFDTCEFGKGTMFRTSFTSTKPWVDKDGKQIPKGYYWYELEDDGVTIKTDDDGNPLPEKRSADEKDIPAANKANGEGYSNGYREVTNPTEDAYYKDFKADITFNSSKIDGKAITKDTNFISNVGSGYNEKGEIATTTRFVLDGKSYKAVKDSDTQEWILIAVE